MNKIPLILLLTLSGCLTLGMAIAVDYPLTVTDSAGRAVTIEAPIEKIVVLNSDAAEAVSILGDTDKIVGATDSVPKYKAYYFSDVMDNWEIVGTWKEFNYEMIADLAKNDAGEIDPGMLVISYANKAGEVEENLAPFEKIDVVGLDLYNAETLEGELTTLGMVLDREAEAEAYKDWVSEKKADVVEAVSGFDKPKVYVEGGYTGDLGSLRTYGQGSALDTMITLASGENIIINQTADIRIDWESVLVQMPEVVINTPTGINQLGWSDTADMEALIADFESRPGADALPAVTNDRVYVIFRDITLGTGAVVGLTYWAKIIHPEVELDPVGVYQEYLEMRGLDYPEENFFVYPAI